MKRILNLAPLVGLALAIGCTEKDSTGPEPGDDYTLEGTETIGPAGGNFETEDFSMRVPAGAFDSDYELELYSSTEDRPFGDDGASRMFRVEGLPAEYLQPLRVSIKYEGALSESGYVAVGEEVFAASLGELTTAYRLLAASDSSGWLVSELPWPGGPAGRYASGTGSRDILTPSTSDAHLGTVSSHAPVTSPGGHFRIEYPVMSVGRADVEALGTFLEEAYSTFRNSLGFTFIDTARTRWPVDVTVRPLGSGVYGYFTASTWGDNYGWMEFNSGEMNDSNQMRLAAGHEFFHLVQSLYDPRNRYSKAKFEPVHYWLNEATAVWSEERFTDQQDYTSPIRDGHEMAPFEGMQKGAEEEAQYHGYGMSAVIKYLVGEYGDGIHVKMYEEIRQETSPVLAVGSSTEDPTVWLEPFFREYVLGNIYDVEPGYWIASDEDVFRINSSDDTLRVFSYSYPDLSARLYKIRLDYPGIDSTATLTAAATGGVGEVTVLKYRSIGGQVGIEYVGYDVDQVTIPNMRALTDEGSHLLVLVTNSRHVPPYAGTSDIDLTIRITEEQEELAYNRCAAMVEFLGHYHADVNLPDTSYSYDYDSDDASVSTWGSYAGSFSGDTFTGSYSGTSGTVTITGTLTATLDPGRTTVTTVEFSQQEVSPDFTISKVFSGTDIPVDYTYYETIIFQIEGEETINHISSLTHTQVAPEGLSFSLTGYECTWDSRIWMSLSVE